MHKANASNDGYSLPLKYRQHLYNLIAPLGTPERDLIATAGTLKLDYYYLAGLVSLCQSNNINYTLYDSGDFYLPDIMISSDDWKRLNQLQLDQYNSVSRLKQFIYEN